MLKKQNRLTKRKDFDRLFHNCQAKYYGNLLGVRLVANNLSYNRFGFMVGHRFCGQAVGRNLVRRRLSALVRQDLPQLKTGYDVVVLMLAKQLPAGYIELRQELLEAWKRLKLIV
jgi:ribonuclease P protein component